jgi:hypothetical protein
MLTWFGEVLHQQWLSADGQSEWRPVPVVEVKPDRRPAVAGWVAEEDEGG